MTWAEYYERYDGWQESTQYSRLASIKDFGPDGSPSEEICDCIQYVDTRTATSILRRALAAGVRFRAAEVAEIADSGQIEDEEALKKLIQTAVDAYTGEQLDTLLSCLPDPEPVFELIDKITSKPTHFTEEDVLTLLPNLPDEESIYQLVNSTDAIFTENGLNELCDYGVDESLIRKISKRSGIPYADPDEQSIKKLPAEDRAWALKKTGFKRLSDDKPVDLTKLTDDDKNQLYYKDEPLTTKKLDQKLIITYSPKYAAYQKAIRAEQICRAEKMVANGSLKKQRKNPNDPARFVNKVAVTNEGEKAKIHYYLDTDKIAEEEMYDGLYAVCTDLLDDDVADILKVSEGRWQIEDCFRTMKTDFEARPVYLNREDRIKAHFLTCFLALLHFRLLNRSLKGTYTTEQLLHTLKDIKFTDIEEQGFMPVYERQEITDDLHETCGFRTDYQFITKRKMKGIQKKSKRR